MHMSRRNVNYNETLGVHVQTLYECLHINGFTFFQVRLQQAIDLPMLYGFTYLLPWWQWHQVPASLNISVLAYPLYFFPTHLK